MLKSLIINFLSIIFINFFSKSEFLARTIFNIKFSKKDKDAYYFDITSIALVKFLKHFLSDDDCLLDLGTGTSALIALSIKKHNGISVFSSDVDEKIVLLAKENIKFNQQKIEVRKSNFFDNFNIKELDSINIISFNAPYVPTKEGKKINLSIKFRTQWDGGPDGTDILRVFLKRFSELKAGKLLVLGINNLHINEDKVKNLTNNFNNLKIINIKKYFLIPSNIYLIKN